MFEDVWDVRYVRGKDIYYGFNFEVKSKLVCVMIMSKGVVFKSVWDSLVLGEIGFGKGDRVMFFVRFIVFNILFNFGGF